MKTKIRHLYLLPLLFFLPIQGSWFFKKTPIIKLPSAQKLKILLASAQLSEFAEETNAISKLAGKKFTGPELDITRQLIILSYQQRRKNFTSNKNNNPKKFTDFICRLIHKNKRVYKEIVTFRKNLQIKHD